MIPVGKLKAVIRSLEILSTTAHQRATGFANVDPLAEGRHRAKDMVKFYMGQRDAYRRAISEIEAIIKGEKE